MAMPKNTKTPPSYKTNLLFKAAPIHASIAAGSFGAFSHILHVLVASVLTVWESNFS